MGRKVDLLLPILLVPLLFLVLALMNSVCQSQVSFMETLTMNCGGKETWARARRPGSLYQALDCKQPPATLSLSPLSCKMVIITLNYRHNPFKHFKFMLLTVLLLVLLPRSPRNFLLDQSAELGPHYLSSFHSLCIVYQWEV